MPQSRLSLHQVCMLERGNAEFLACCREIGVGAAVLASTAIAGPDLDEVREDLSGGGLRVESVNHLFCPDLSQAGGAASAQAVEVVATAQALGARSVYLLTGGRGTLDWADAADRFTELIAPARQAARDRGIELLVENASALYADIHIAHSLADTLALAQRSGLGLCIDLFFCWAEAGLPALLRQAVPLAGLVQVSDYVLGDRALPARAVPGNGAIPLQRILADVLDAGYQGTFDIELVGPRIVREGPQAAASRAAAHLSALLSDLGV